MVFKYTAEKFAVSPCSKVEGGSDRSESFSLCSQSQTWCTCRYLIYRGWWWWWWWAILSRQGFKSPPLISWAPQNTGKDDKEWGRREALTQQGTQMATPWIQHSNPGLIRVKGQGVDWVFCPGPSQYTWQKKSRLSYFQSLEGCPHFGR